MIVIVQNSRASLRRRYTIV